MHINIQSVFQNIVFINKIEKEFLKFEISSQAPCPWNKILLVSVKVLGTLPNSRQELGR